MSKTGLTSESVVKLATNLKHATSLTYIDMSGNRLRCFESMMDFCDSLANLFKLESLNLSENHLGDQVTCKLAKVLSIHANIKVLKLNCVEMSPIGLSALKQHLRTSSHLKLLSLARNHFSSDLLNFVEVLKPLAGIQSKDFTKIKFLLHLRNYTLKSVTNLRSPALVH